MSSRVFWTILLVGMLVSVSVVQAAPNPRQAETVNVSALAVAETSQGFLGVAASVEATVLAEGAGQVFVSTKPLAQADMQGSARLAARVAASTLGATWQDYDYLVEFRSGSTVIGGPSAGAVMTLALATALHNLMQPEDTWTLDAGVAATGTINPDGTIGPVGGVPNKATAARDAGIHTFIYPAGMEVAQTVEAGPFGLQSVAVDMASHCRELGIRCVPAASIESLLRYAAGVQIERPDIEAPSTADFEAQLSPTVTAQVSRLQGRVGRGAAADVSNLSDSQKERIVSHWLDAEIRLVRAQESLDDGAYYLSATHTFQGHIFAARAENLTTFYQRGNDEQVVIEVLEDCAEAVENARARVASVAPTGINQIHAYAAAQDRVHGAQSLYAESQVQYGQAFRFEDWIQSMFLSTFCVERTTTVHWWADLADAFGPGPEVADAQGIVSEAIDQALDLVAYAEAVSGQALSAQARLTEAQEMREAGMQWGALAAAVEAQSLASVSVQQAGTASIPEEVLQAAADGAARSIAQSRLRGAEPVLPVSLVELSAIQEDSSSALVNLWTARTLALVGAEPVAPSVSRAPVSSYGYDDRAVVAFLGIGALLGGAVMAVVWGISGVRRD